MHITNISEAKAQLSSLIEKVLAGEEVLIGKAGKPVAKLVRYERSNKKRIPGVLKGKIKIADDFDILPKTSPKRSEYRTRELKACLCTIVIHSTGCLLSKPISKVSPL